MIQFLLIALFVTASAAVYFYGRHQLLIQENARLLDDNEALRDKVLAKHGFTALHETAETKTRRQDQVMSLVPPIHAAIAAEEEAEERAYNLSQEKQDELIEEARRRSA